VIEIWNENGISGGNKTVSKTDLRRYKTSLHGHQEQTAHRKPRTVSLPSAGRAAGADAGFADYYHNGDDLAVHKFHALGDDHLDCSVGFLSGLGGDCSCCCCGCHVGCG